MVVEVVVIIVVVVTDFVRVAFVITVGVLSIVMCMLCHGGSDIVKGFSGCGGNCREPAVMV